METGLKRLIKHSGIYALGSAMQGFAAMILVPIYTKNLPVSAFGQLELINTIILISINIISLGLASAYIKTHEDIKTSEEKKSLTTTTLLFSIIVLLPSIVIYAALIPSATNLLKLEDPTLLYLALGIISTSIISNIGFSILRSQEKSIAFSFTNILRFILLLGINSYLVLVAKKGVDGVLLGLMLAHIITLVSFIPTFIKNTNKHFSKKLLKNLLSFGIAVIPAGLAMWVMDLIDRYIINAYFGPELVGYYSLVYKFGIALSIILVTPFQLAWPTYSFSIAEKPEAKKTFSRTLSLFLGLSLFLVVGMVIFGKYGILILARKEYLQYESLILPITLSYVLLGAHYLIVSGLHIAKKSKYYPILVVIPSILNICLNMWLIPQYNILGASVATLTSFTLMLILTIILVQKYYKFIYNFADILKVVIATLATLLPFYLFPETTFYIKILITLIYPLILISSGFIKKNEFQSALKLLKLQKNS